MNTYKHKQKNITVKVDTRRNKPVITKLGMIELRNITKNDEQVGLYRGCNAITADEFENSFERVG